MPGYLYLPVYLFVTLTMAFIMSFRYISSSGFELQIKKNNINASFFICLILVFWLGNRPVNGSLFGDMSTYNAWYNGMVGGKIDFWGEGEWVWSAILIICKNAGLNNHEFFTVVEAGYVLLALWAIKRFMPTNPMLGLLFMLTSLMFFSFGTNGIRNGLACHVLLLAISFILADNYLMGIFLCLMAFGIHKSVILPIAAVFAGIFLIKNFKFVIYFWIISIIISLAFGNSIAVFFASLGFDDRMSSYLTNQYADSFSSTGFRWDFLLYSAIPIFLGWYVLIKKGIKDRWYEVLCVTYTLSNAFWVMVIRAAFSNRFAYLSWFLYPIIIAYPLINLPVWYDQDKKTGLILLFYSGFTLFMMTFYW